MAYITEFTRVTFGGSIADGQDEWNCGFALELLPDGLDWATSAAAVSTDIKDLIVDFWTDPLLSTPQGATLDYVKLAHIDTDGTYMEAPVVVPVSPTPGALAGNYVPQISTVVTLQSNKYKDPGKYNRFYLPVGNLTGTGDYQLSTIEQGRLLTAAQTLFNGINAITTGGTTIVTICASNSSLVTTVEPAVFVKVGRVLDTQRRRRNKISESYDSLPIT